MGEKTKMEATSYKGTNKLIVGIVFGVITYWLFAQSMVNVVPAVQQDLGISLSILNVGISMTALFSGIFIAVTGGLADKIGRVKMTYLGFILSIVGSLLLIICQGTFLLIVARIIQGLSAACIMPATLALMKTYFEGADRQRALSYWSIGSWGGSGICSFAGGGIATYLGWRWIFVFSIVIALIGMILIKGTPESKVARSETETSFDYGGLVTFIVSMVALNLVITRGGQFGWTSLTTLILAGVFLLFVSLFFYIENRKANGFIDFSLFKEKKYLGATLSNFLLNTVAGTLAVGSMYVQEGRGLTSFQAGLLSLGYLACVLITIRIGEKLLQKMGAKKPMVIGSILAAVGVIMMSLTFVEGMTFHVVYFLGFALLGTGLGVYATPSTDTAISSAPLDKVGMASGVYKMASSLGGSFGVAISVAVYAIVKNTSGIETAGMVGLLTNVFFCLVSLVAIVVVVPNHE